MNPFVELPVVTKAGNWFFKKEKETTGRILPGEIAFHYPDAKGRSVVILKSGASFVTALDSLSLDSARQVYDTMLKRNPGRTENLQIIRNDKQKTNGTIPGNKLLKVE